VSESAWTWLFFGCLAIAMDHRALSYGEIRLLYGARETEGLPDAAERSGAQAGAGFAGVLRSADHQSEDSGGDHGRGDHAPPQVAFGEQLAAEVGTDHH